jgi:hypothetical protein
MLTLIRKALLLMLMCVMWKTAHGAPYMVLTNNVAKCVQVEVLAPFTTLAIAYEAPGMFRSAQQI